MRDGFTSLNFLTGGVYNRVIVTDILVDTKRFFCPFLHLFLQQKYPELHEAFYPGFLNNA